MGFLAGLAWLSPAGLLGLAAIIAPILIHLFSRSRGRRVMIGNIDLVRHAHRKRVTEVHITQWLLLILRLLILVVAALILAQLSLRGLESTDRDTVYVTPAWLSGVSPSELDAVRSKPETDLYLLAPGYPPPGTGAFDSVMNSDSTADTDSLWPLLAERLSRVDHRAGVDVYTAGLVPEFGYRIPALPRPVNWHSRPVQLSYTAPAVRALILHDPEREVDAMRLNAAFGALNRYRLPGLSWQVRVLDDDAAIPAEYDWLIVLSTDFPNLYTPASRERRLTLLEDASLLENKTAFATAEEYPFTRFEVRQSDPAPLPGATLWKNEHGQAVLTEQFEPGARRLRFVSRFNETASDLVLQAGFPETLMGLLLAPEQRTDTLSSSHVAPAQIDHAVVLAGEGMPLPHRSLQTWLALLLVILWAAERWFSERSRNED